MRAGIKWSALIAGKISSSHSASGGWHYVIRRTCQVHGKDFVWVNAEGNIGQLPSADAILTDDERCVACVRTADCVPVLIGSEDGRVVAAVHAGWRAIVTGEGTNDSFFIMKGVG